MFLQSLHLRKSLLVACVALLSFSNYNALAQKTTIWLVRHAEKATTDPSERDPALSGPGLQRAAALAEALKSAGLHTIYVTDYKRSKQTTAPLANQLGLTPEVYKVGQPDSIAALAFRENRGSQALIVGHSNTLLPIVKSLGIPLTLKELGDDDYDMLFKIVLVERNQAVITGMKISRYGTSHHTTEIPKEYQE
jgi:2,3-bisphosphoglycerate-dependent phosphoglycerate mutase